VTNDPGGNERVMLHRFSRRLLPFAFLCVLAVVATPSAASAGVRVGVSDNSAAMFYQGSFQRLHVPIARDMVPWNAAVTRDKSALNAAKAWVAAAQATHVEPMIAFNADAGRAGNYVPSVGVYTTAIRAFLQAVPSVKVYAPWNEPDFVFRSLAKRPQLAAAYFNAMVRYCRGCTIVAGEVYRATWEGLASWLRAYQRGLHSRPVAWAIHPYADVRTHTASQIRTLVSVVHPRQIWLTEISGVERRGHWPWPDQSPNAANNDERFQFSLAMRFRQITRIYHYQWQAVPSAFWDSGLLGPGGQPRPAYWTFANAVNGKL
jgi:hypothetical protein